MVVWQYTIMYIDVHVLTIINSGDDIMAYNIRVIT